MTPAGLGAGAMKVAIVGLGKNGRCRAGTAERRWRLNQRTIRNPEVFANRAR